MGAGPKIQCLQCDDIIQSMHRHDLVWCKEKHIAVDGGSEYFRLLGDIEKMAYEGSEKNEKS
jgi:hypothetical protein